MTMFFQTEGVPAAGGGCVAGCNPESTGAGGGAAGGVNSAAAGIICWSGGGAGGAFMAGVSASMFVVGVDVAVSSAIRKTPEQLQKQEGRPSAAMCERCVPHRPDRSA